MGLRCTRCDTSNYVKNGRMRGKQRYRCKTCGRNFTAMPPRLMYPEFKKAALLLYFKGDYSMNQIGKLLGVSTASVQAWIRQFGIPVGKLAELKERGVMIGSKGEAALDNIIKEFDKSWIDLAQLAVERLNEMNTKKIEYLEQTVGKFSVEWAVGELIYEVSKSLPDPIRGFRFRRPPRSHARAKS